MNMSSTAMPVWPESQFAGHFSPEYSAFVNQDWSELPYGPSEGSFISPGAAMSPLTLPDGLFYEAESPLTHSPLSDDSPDMVYQDFTGSSVQGDDSPGFTYVQPSAFYFDPLLGADLKSHMIQHIPSRPCSSYSEASVSPHFIRPSFDGQRTPIRIAPNPLQVRQIEERKHIQERERTRRPTRTRKRTNTKSMQMERETTMVASLKAQNLPWSEIVKKVNAKFETNHTASCLQMRLSRFNKRQRDWAGSLSSLSGSVSGSFGGSISSTP